VKKSESPFDIRALESPRAGRAELAANCLGEITSLCDGADTTLTAAPRETFMYDPKHPPPPGALERRELRAQTETLERLRPAMAPSTHFVVALRERARQQSIWYAKAANRLVVRSRRRAGTPRVGRSSVHTEKL